MNKHIVLTTDMLKCIDRFLQDHPIEPPIPRLNAAQAEVVTAIAALDQAAEAQLTGAHRSEGGVDLRETTARELRAYLKDVCRTGRSLDDEHPGIRPIFRLPESGSYPALLIAARSIIATATPFASSFIEAGLPETFLAELQSLVTAFEAATGQKHSGRMNRTLYTAALKEKAKAGLAAAKKLDVYVRNHFRGNAEMLAAWTSARHIQRPSKSRKLVPSAAPASVESTPTPHPEPALAAVLRSHTDGTGTELIPPALRIELQLTSPSSPTPPDDAAPAKPV